jgi:hypothetical protein
MSQDSQWNIFNILQDSFKQPYVPSLCAAIRAWLHEHHSELHEEHLSNFLRNLETIIPKDSTKIQISNHKLFRRRKKEPWHAVYLAFIFGPEIVKRHKRLIKAFEEGYGKDMRLPDRVPEVAGFIQARNAKLEVQQTRARVAKWEAQLAEQGYENVVEGMQFMPDEAQEAFVETQVVPEEAEEVPEVAIKIDPLLEW